MAQAHARGLAAQDSLALFATEATPYTAETFAAGDYLRLSGRPTFIPVNDPDDLGEMLGGFDRGVILPGTMYAKFAGETPLRRSADIDDGPEEPFRTIVGGAGMLGTVDTGVSYTFTRSNDPTVWEAARYTARIDHHGDNKIIYGCLTEQLTYNYMAGKAVRVGFSGCGLVSGTYATHRPAEDNPASRTPALSYSAGQSAPPFVFAGATIQYAGSSALKIESMTIQVDCTPVPVMSGNATFGVDGVILVDRVITAQLNMLRPLQATKKLDEEYLWNSNNSLAGGSLIVTLTSGSRTLVQTLSGMMQSGYPQETVVNGKNHVIVNLRGQATFTQAYT